MFSRVFIFCSCLFALAGCVYRNEPMPEIVYHPGVGPKPVPPRAAKPQQTRKDANLKVPRDWLPPARLEKRWTAIVVHHSATENGNAAIFDRMHREEKQWEGIGYDFVIGNGSSSADGQVEVTFRWREQMTGAHCGGTPGNWANEDAVGICLVGNFNHTLPTAAQMESLVKLIRFLQKRYGIPKSSIYGHRTTPGARVTDCPGKKFPLARLKSMLGS